MNSGEWLASEIRRSASGETWFGPSLARVLEGVEADRASMAVDGAPHSIWELVLHVGVWTRYATYRFEGGVPRDLDEANWPPVPNGGDIAWASARDDAIDSLERAAIALASLSEEALDVVDAHTPSDATGEPVTLRRVAAGLSEHVAYHAGQMALVKHLIAHRDPA